MLSIMNTHEQDDILNAVKQNSNVLISGAGGTGKTHTIRSIYKYATENNIQVQVCALTGCAAFLLQCKAVTIHSWAGIGIAKGTIDELSNVVVRSFFKKKVWMKVKLLIIDEVSMMSKKLFELLNMIGQKVHKNTKPFGGIQVVLSGDFHQLSPVGDIQDPDSTKFCFESEFFSSMFKQSNTFLLTHNFRQQNDNDYFQILNEIREGKLSNSAIDILKTYVGRPFGDVTPTMLFPTRKQVTDLNMNSLAKVNENSVSFQAIRYELRDDELTLQERKLTNSSSFSQEQINFEIDSMMKNFNGEQNLFLKKGCKVMFIVNLTDTIVNGTKGTIIRFTADGNPVVQTETGENVHVSPFVWKSEKIPHVGIKQLPLMLAYAVSLHRSQGMSLTSACIDLGSSIFTTGQSYVGLSRIRSLDGLYLFDFDPSKVMCDQRVTSFYSQISSTSIE